MVPFARPGAPRHRSAAQTTRPTQAHRMPRGSGACVLPLPGAPIYSPSRPPGRKILRV
jgi:hypothetical protein